MSLKIVDDLDSAIALFNRYSPQFTVSLLSEDAATQERFYNAVNAPFVGNGITRWVDGQYALNKPELGLSNWKADACLPVARFSRAMACSRSVAA